MVLRNTAHVVILFRSRVLWSVLLYFLYRYLVPKSIEQMEVRDLKWKRVVKEF